VIGYQISDLLSSSGYCEGAWMNPYPPSLDVYGSYFPAWLICLFAGIILTVFVSLIGRSFNLRLVRIGPLMPVSLILIFSITLWFLFFAP
jgi:hypothetical protein